jgi:hypothetical protein
MGTKSGDFAQRRLRTAAILLKISIAVHSIRSSSWTETNKNKKQSKIFHRQKFFFWALSFTLWYK